MSCARNVGIYESKGRYLLFADQDDYAESNHIENLVNGIEENGAQLSACGYKRLSGDKMTTFSYPRETVCKVNKEMFCGYGFAGAILSSRILAWRILFSSINCFVIVYLFIPISKEKWALFTTGMAALFNFTGNMLLIPAFNQTGAAVVNIGTEILETVIIIVLLRNYIRARDILKNLLQCMLGCVYIVGVYCVISGFVQNMYILLGITAIFGALGYFAILYLLKNEYLSKFLTLIFNK